MGFATARVIWGSGILGLWGPEGRLVAWTQDEGPLKHDDVCCCVELGHWAHGAWGMPSWVWRLGSGATNDEAICCQLGHAAPETKQLRSKTKQ